MKKIFLFLILTQFIISCFNDSTETKDDNEIKNGKYFAVGSKYGRNKDNNFTQLASIWVDGVPTILSNTGSSSTANAIAFYNNDRYVVGTESLENGNDILKVWKNNTSESLTDGAHHVEANDIAISEGNVYVVGNDYVGYNNSSIATVWKNGQAIHLTDEISEANAIYIYNNEVYIAGYQEYYDKNTARVWKLNQSRTFLYTEKDDLESIATDIYVDNTGVYVSGYLRNTTKSTPILWKNAIAATLSDADVFSEAKGIFVYNSDVYVCGYDINTEKYDFKGKIWKNGVLVKEINNAKLDCIYINDNKIYTAGFGLNDTKVDQEAKIWESNLNNLNFSSKYRFANGEINAVLIK